MEKILLLLSVSILPFLLNAFVSCEKVDTDVENISISLRHGEVEPSQGSQFVSVQAEGDWVITLSFQGGEKDWAETDAVSGHGDRNDILLRYTENTFREGRDLRTVAEGLPDRRWRHTGVRRG